MRISLCAAIGALIAGTAFSGPASADKLKIDFWYGNSGDISKRVQEVCQHFNDSQTDYEVTCTSQGSYYGAVQKTIAAFRAGKPPTIVQVFDVGTLGFRPEEATIAEKGAETLSFTLEMVEEIGTGRLLHGRMAETEVVLALPATTRTLTPGMVVGVHVPETELHLFDSDTGLRLSGSLLTLAAE